VWCVFDQVCVCVCAFVHALWGGRGGASIGLLRHEELSVLPYKDMRTLQETQEEAVKSDNTRRPARLD